jgi:hypothetical protein
MTFIPEDGEFYVVRPLYDSSGVGGFECLPVIGWRIEGNPDTDQLNPVIEDDELEPDELYALCHPDGSYRFPDGERCRSDDELVASFKRRRLSRRDG